MTRIRTIVLSSAAAGAVALAVAARTPHDDLGSRRSALNDLLAEHWDYTLSTTPEFASILGDRRWNDRSSDHSLAAIEKDLARQREYLRRFSAIDVKDFPEQEELNSVLMRRDLAEGLEGAKFKSWEMPVNTRDLTADEKATIVPILMALAGSIRAGLDKAELGWPARVHRPSPDLSPEGRGAEEDQFPPAQADRVAVQPALARAAARGAGDAAATAVSPVSFQDIAGG